MRNNPRMVLHTHYISDIYVSDKIYVLDKKEQRGNRIGPGSKYGRILRIEYSLRGDNGRLLAGFERSTPSVSTPPDDMNGYAVYESCDDGHQWNQIATIFDTVNPETRAVWCHHFFELPRAFGGMEKGTLLCAGISVAKDIGTFVKIYRSCDGGRSFEQIATVDAGGVPGSGLCEPFLELLDDNRLVCYYSDETMFEKHSQKLVYKVSSDAIRWSEKKDIIASATVTARPGMPVVTRLGDGRYFMVYEMVGIEGNPIYCRYSPDGLDWGDPEDIGRVVQSENGARLGSSPYCGWTPFGGGMGTLIVSGAFMCSGSSETGSDYFISHDYGQSWYTIPHPIPYSESDHTSHNGYSNSFFFAQGGDKLYSINNRGINAAQTATTVAVSSLSMDMEISL